MARDKETDVELEVEGDAAESRVYELAFHIDAELPQEEAKKAYQAIKDLVTSNGTLVAEGEIQKIPLAYTISRMDTTGRRDFNSAFFGWIAYEAAGEGHSAITAAMGANTKVFRFLDIRTTKEEAQHSAEMHEFYAKAPEQLAETEEVPAEAELDAALKEVGVV